MKRRKGVTTGKLGVLLSVILLACSIGLGIVFAMVSSYDLLARRTMRIEQAASTVRAIAEVHDMRVSAMRHLLAPTPASLMEAREKFDLLYSRLVMLGEGFTAKIHAESSMAAAGFRDIVAQLKRADAVLLSMVADRPAPEFEKAVSTLVPQLESYAALVRDYLIDDTQNNSDEMRRLLNWQITLTVLTFGSVIVAFVISLFQNRHLVQANALITEASHQYEYLANHDAMTGLPNRRHVQQLVEIMCCEGRFTLDRVAVACLDIDRFKQINDTLGHFAGDELVIQFASRLQEFVKPGMSVALGRQGGDEFVFAVAYDGASFDPHAFFERLQKRLSERYMLHDHAVMVGASIGLTIESIVAAEWVRLLTQADIALKNAKERGRGQIAVYEDGMVEDVVDRHQLEQDLRSALGNNEFRLHYQPIIALNGIRPMGFEALLRWQHPVLGMVSPARFIPIAEDTGLIVDIGAWVIREACATAAALPEDIRISVNISAVQMLRTNIARTIREALTASNLPGQRLIVELTESIMLDNEQRFSEMFDELSSLGVGLALDDFGTGFSSLSYLRRYRFERLKVDRSFVADVERDSEARLLVKYMIDLGRALSMSVTAEGVETAGQALLLTADGCDMAQGYYFAKPQPIESFHGCLDWSGGRSGPLPLAGEPLPDAPAARAKAVA